MTIHPAFGWLMFWPEVEHAPLGDPEERVKFLWEIFQKGLSKPLIPLQVQKAFALELVLHFTLIVRPLPEDLIRLVGGLLELPASFPDNPVQVLTGKNNGGRPGSAPEAREVARWLDGVHFTATSGWMPLVRLRSEVAKVLGTDNRPSRASLRRWRAEADYQSVVRSGDDLFKPL